ncbi:MAG: Hsp70 family protein [Treponema sp.]|nr:Hsp70 family protein [Treponema sp.]MCL2271522.1 Hsp70 family protein [Treponema sp.]
MPSSIGIKIANGEFFPLVEENSPVKKKLVLTTVHDNQQSTQIDLYRSSTKTMADSQYVGSLVVENIRPRPKGEPSIELMISSNSKGELIADAIDLDTSSGSEHYVLTVSLKTIDETSKDMDIPEFNPDSEEEPPPGLYNHAEKIRQTKKRKLFTWLFIIVGLIILLGGLAAWLFFFNGMNFVQSKLPVVQQAVQQYVIEPVKQFVTGVIEFFTKKSVSAVSVAQPVIISGAVKPPDLEPVRQIEVVSVIEALQPTITVLSLFNIPSYIPREGVNYRIRRGDTLRNISEAFYQDPLLYERIAKQNGIHNPNHIISGRTIRIPPVN